MEKWNVWQLFAIMDDNLPGAPTSVAGKGHKTMAYQWWCLGSPTTGPPKAMTGAISMKPNDRLQIFCVHSNPNFPEGEVKICVEFKKIVNNELVEGSPLSTENTDVWKNGVNIERSWVGDASLFEHLYDGYKTWTPGMFLIRNKGEYTLTIDFHGPEGVAGKYFLDPMLRVDP